MDLEVIVSWDKSKAVEEAGQFDLVVKVNEPLEGFNEQYRGHRKGWDDVRTWVAELFEDATAGEFRHTNYVFDEKNDDLLPLHQYPNPISEESGRKAYKVDVKPRTLNASITADREESPDVRLKKKLEELGKKYYIATRGEWVNNQDYYSFWGRGDSYMPGDEVELLRQTVWEIRHGNPHIWAWANVPKFTQPGDSKYVKNYPRLDKVVAELSPLVSALDGVSTNNARIKLYNQIADRLDRYKREQGIERLEVFGDS